MHHWERAAFFYNEYLHKTPAAPNRADVQALIADVRQKLQGEVAAARPKAEPAAEPKPAQPILVEAPPQVVPAAAIEASPPPSHGHGLGIGLLSGGLALGVLTGISALEIVHYNGSYASAANQGPAGAVTYNAATQSQAGVWQIVEIASAVLAVAGVAVAPFVW